MLAHPHSKAGWVFYLFAKVLFMLCRALLTLPLAHDWPLPLLLFRPRQICPVSREFGALGCFVVARAGV
jgi:hypothetical protein